MRVAKRAIVTLGLMAELAWWGAGDGLGQYVERALGFHLYHNQIFPLSIIRPGVTVLGSNIASQVCWEDALQ